jgi:serine/threonine protein kinase
MEQLEGGNLERAVQQGGPMEIASACQLIAEAAAGLAHAHHRGIVHRDIKPSNLLLSRNGRCKVGDFGFSMVETPAGGSGGAGALRCVGMPHFVAPEVAGGRPATASSDLYSLGCTLFFLLTGRPPFPATGARQALKMHVTDPMPDVRQWRADAPPRLAEAIAQAGAKDPHHRHASAEQFAAVLRTFTIPTPASSSKSRSSGHSDGEVAGTPFEAVESSHPVAMPPASGAEPPRANSRRRWIGLAGAAVVDSG